MRAIASAHLLLATCLAFALVGLPAAARAGDVAAIATNPLAEKELAQFGQILDPLHPLQQPGPFDEFNRTILAAQYQISGQFAQVLRLCRYDEAVVTDVTKRRNARTCQRVALLNLERYQEAEAQALADGALLPDATSPDPVMIARDWHWSATLAANLGQVRVAEASYRQVLAQVARVRAGGPAGILAGTGADVNESYLSLRESMLTDNELTARTKLDEIAWYLQRSPAYLDGAGQTLARAKALTPAGEEGSHAELAILHAARLWQLGRRDEATALAVSITPALRAHAGFRDQPEPLTDFRPLGAVNAVLGDERTQPLHVTSWVRLARAYALAGRMAEAQRLLVAADGMARRYLLEPEQGNTLLAQVEQASADLATMRGAPDEALPALRRARARLLAAGAAERAAEVGRRQLRLDSEVLQVGASILAAMTGGTAVTFAAGSQEEREAAAIALDFTASRALLNNELADRAQRATGTAADLLRRDGMLVDELVELRGRMTAALGTGAAPREDSTALMRRLAALHAELAAVKRLLSEEGGGAPADAADARPLSERLGTDAAYFQWIAHPAGNLVLCWRRTGVTIAPLRVPAAEILRLAQLVHAGSTTRGARTVATLPRFPRAEAAALYAALFGPVAQAAAGSTRWFVANSTLVDGIPWAALVTGLRGAEATWLVDKAAVTITPSWRTAAASPARRPTGDGETLLVGDPRNAGSIARPGQLPTRAVFVAAATGLAPASFAPRNAMALELDRVAAMFPPGRLTVLRAGTATKDRLLRLPLDRYRLLVFTTHGYMAADYAATVGPGLELTAPNGTLAERLLTAREVARLRLRADLAVLSACDTSAPDGYPDSEGFSGLTSAFLLAGAHNVVASLWPVETHATGRVITAMLAQYSRGQPDIAVALQQAMQAYLRGSDPLHRHPAFWAAFQHVGR